MASSAKGASGRIALVAGLAAVLVLLAVLQYRWSLEISRAERTRIESSLNTSVNLFRQEFYRELEQVSTAFRRDPEASAGAFWSTYPDQYQAWERTAAHPDLVASIYVFDAGKSASAPLLRLRPAEGDFERVSEWPPALAGLRSVLDARVKDESPRPLGPPLAELRSFAWTLEQRIPALVHPVFSFSGTVRWRPDRPPVPPPHMLSGFVIVELSRAAIDRLLGELAQRYFAGPDGFIYNVEVVSIAPAAGVVYRSDPQLTAGSLNPPDARVALLAATAAENRAIEGAPPRDGGRRPRAGRAGRGGAARGTFPMRARAALIFPSSAEEPWQLVVRHKGGSLESVVAADRRRNLLLSFGVLLLLAVSMALIVISAQRVRRLARLQMEFVAGVSHELRTPVAVIGSAADNLAQGLVVNRDQVKEYGALIRNQGRRLAGMIEQILQFAAGQSRAARYDLGPVPVAEAIDQVLAGAGSLPEAEGFTIEREIAPDLPPLQADSAALVRCLENLVLNAFKYGAKGRWLGIRAQAADGGTRVRIRIEDRGDGIDPADLPHIFQPFYRGRAAQAAQIHGAGLGLSLARDIAEGMGGALTAASEPGRGSTFTLELAAAPQPVAEPLPRTA